MTKTQELIKSIKDLGVRISITSTTYACGNHVTYVNAGTCRVQDLLHVSECKSIYVVDNCKIRNMSGTANIAGRVVAVVFDDKTAIMISNVIPFEAFPLS